ncbi:MAG TPA: 5-(carboxyamino)imidazole ribonucleotide synthase [Synechococcales cyanobacterium M55_K2018_004]|nr:5-(carboxyamino)imidazole ribonucleotide synthase [Synechococcales cyanobacterium M55_K2018_004]
MKRVGVIGGGQLAWMMGGAAKTLGIELVVQTPSLTDPAVRVAASTVLGAIADATATATLAQQCDVITFENEFVDLEALAKLADQGVQFYPRLEAIVLILDKFHQRSFYQRIGVPTPNFLAWEAGTPNPFGFPVVLKARRHGYDGYGTFICQNAAELEAASQNSEQRWLLEQFVPFERELAVIAARSPAGEMVIYPVVESIQGEGQVCRQVYLTGEFDGEVSQQVEAIARNLLTALDYVGVLGIELFLTPTGQVLVNEIAPRTHNTGHYTLDACVTSQFEQQLRAVCGMPLGSPALTCAGAVMVNLLGFESSESDYAEKRQQLATLPNAHVYWYGKTQTRPGRKVGHVTVTLQPGANRTTAEQFAQWIESIWYPS